MEQLEFFDVPSPCVRVCTVDEKGYCQGCMRNRQERFNWLNMTTEEKLNVIKLCQRRYRRKRMEQLNIKKPSEIIPTASDASDNDQQPELF
ncbi:DUF1289 domain-containing protein [Vibrio sp.]|uniref:DUF1289 domain-containing protein n=1 Tax=Vibrio viridaestus TaxID=2487322 RepID=A0A3N9THR4_9VIBR|nr:DUF1289 domain-containing protein [Vibrio viridaestus]MDC0612105.1 DUF1289 domain-containing protein [Vibrio sp.]RQW63434.1 DUF1289 domain-containing protein [Vibrio viridaestus]